MKYHSDFNKGYVNDICTEMQNIKAQNFTTFTKLLQNKVIMSQSIFSHLDDLGLVNRGFCPYTGEKIDNSFPSWSYQNSRRVYVSHEGYKIMQKEADEEFERIMGRPAPTRTTDGGNKSNGCYIATACYGNELAPEVIMLKAYRDEKLSKTFLGRLFIKTYYFLSPSIADKLKNKTNLNTFIRVNILNKIVNKIN